MTHVLYGPLATYVNLRITHALGMPGTFSTPPWVGDPDMHQGKPSCMAGSLTSSFLWSPWLGKHSRHSPAHTQPAIYVFGNRPIYLILELMYPIHRIRQAIEMYKMFMIFWIIHCNLLMNTLWPVTQFRMSLNQMQVRSIIDNVFILNGVIDECKAIYRCLFCRLKVCIWSDKT